MNAPPKLERLRRAVADAGPGTSSATLASLLRDVDRAEEKCERFSALGNAVARRSPEFVDCLQTALDAFESRPQVKKANKALFTDLVSVLAKAQERGVTNSEVRAEVEDVLSQVGHVFASEDGQLSSRARSLAQFLAETDDAEEAAARELEHVAAGARQTTKRDSVESESESEDDEELPARQRLARRVARVEKKLQKHPDTAQAKKHLRAVRKLHSLLEDSDEELPDEVLERIAGDVARVEESAKRFEKITVAAHERAPAVIVCLPDVQEVQNTR